MEGEKFLVSDHIMGDSFVNLESSDFSDPYCIGYHFFLIVAGWVLYNGF